MNRLKNMGPPASAPGLGALFPYTFPVKALKNDSGVMKPLTRSENPPREQKRRLSAMLGMALALGLGGSGCAHFERLALQRSEVYYRSVQGEMHPQKPETAPIPILDTRPKNSRLLGVFQFTTERNREFAIKSAQHNARKVGADAIFIRGLGEGQIPRHRFEPAHWESRTQMRTHSRRRVVQGTGGAPDQVVVDTYVVPRTEHEFVPARSWTEILHYTSIDALILKLP